MLDLSVVRAIMGLLVVKAQDLLVVGAMLDIAAVEDYLEALRLNTIITPLYQTEMLIPPLEI